MATRTTGSKLAAFALCGVVTTTTVIALADTYTWHGPNDAVGSGTFGTDGNWFDSTGSRTQTIPGSEDAVKVGVAANNYTVQTVTLDGDKSVASLTVEGGNFWAQNKVAYLTLALAGHTLDVGGQLYAQGEYGWNNYRSGKCIINGGGTVNVASVQVGHTDYFNKWSTGSGSLYVQGSGTKLVSTGEIMLAGPATTFQVSGGATVSGQDLTVAGQSSNPTGSNLERSVVSISGSGTKVDLRGFALHHNVDATISDGAVVTTTSCGYYRHGSGGLNIASLSRVFYGNCVGGAWGGYGTWCGNYGTLVVDNATYTSNPRQHFAVGCSRAASGGSGATLTLQNGAKFDSGEFFIGVSIEDKSYNSTNNVLNVLSGSELEASIVRVSERGNTSFGKVNVSNATIKCEQFLMGNYISATIMNSNACLTVSGTAPKITLSNTSATAFKVRMGSQVRFILPADGFAATPIVVSNGGVSIVADEGSYAVDPVRLVIDGKAFGRRSGGESQTLIECKTASAESLQRLADNVEFVNTPEYLRGTVMVVGGTKLVYTAPPKRGMILSFR